jgi:hypothetical protein
LGEGACTDANIVVPERFVGLFYRQALLEASKRGAIRDDSHPPSRCDPRGRYGSLFAADGGGQGRHARTRQAQRRELLNPKIAQHHGRSVEAMGDAVMVEFRTAVDA